MDAISGIVGLTAIGVAGVAALGLFGRQVPRYNQIVAVVVVVYFIAMATLLSVAQQFSLAGGVFVAGLLIAALLILTGAPTGEPLDDQGRDRWGR